MARYWPRTIQEILLIGWKSKLHHLCELWLVNIPTSVMIGLHNYRVLLIWNQRDSFMYKLTILFLKPSSFIAFLACVGKRQRPFLKVKTNREFVKILCMIGLFYNFELLNFCYNFIRIIQIFIFSQLLGDFLVLQNLTSSVYIKFSGWGAIVINVSWN